IPQLFGEALALSSREDATPYFAPVSTPIPGGSAPPRVDNLYFLPEHSSPGAPAASPGATGASPGSPAGYPNAPATYPSAPAAYPSAPHSYPNAPANAGAALGEAFVI